MRIAVDDDSQVVCDHDMVEEVGEMKMMKMMKMMDDD